MPPRLRKTAAVKSEANAPEVLPDEAAVQTPADSAEPTPSGAVEESQNDGVPAAAEPEPGPAVAPAGSLPTSHWELVGLPGFEDTPCRMCLTGGPPDGAGSIGCSHGQWVRVWMEGGS